MAAQLKGPAPRYHVVSFRVTDEELTTLKQLRKKRRTTLDHLVREALSTTDLLVGCDSEQDPMPKICARR